MRVEEEFENVMINIEIQVITVSNEYPELSDAGVERVYNALLSKYKAIGRGKEPKEPSFRSEAEQELFALIDTVSDLFTGVDKESELADVFEGQDEVSAENMAAIFKRLRKSLRTWTKQGGSKGYIYYIAQFLPTFSNQDKFNENPTVDEHIEKAAKYLGEN